MLVIRKPLTPVGQVIELTLRDLRHKGVEGVSLVELVGETGRTERAVRDGLKQLLDLGLVWREERKDPLRNCRLAAHFHLR